MRPKPPPYLHIARWLTAGLVLLILWGSLFPFDFVPRNYWQLRNRLLAGFSPRMSRSDLISNVLIYLPLGAMLMLSLFGRRRWMQVLVATMLGSALSFTLEFAQAFTPRRVTSIYDWLSNSVGAFCGALMISVYLLVGHRWRFRSLVDPRPALVPMWVILLWLFSQFSPYKAVLDSAQLQASTDSLEHHYVWSVLDGSLAIAAWLVLAETMRRIWMPRYAAAALAGLIAATLFARLWIIDQRLRFEEVIAWIIAVASLFIAREPHSRLRAGIAACACAMALLLAGLWPFQFSADPQRFHWVPFSGNLLLTRDYQPLLEKLFLYAALLWTLTLAAGRLRIAFIAAFALTTMVELQQMWMPDRRAEITDPLLIALLTAAFFLAREFQPYALGMSWKRASKA
ncbi:MAG: VanZ family protein [Steroidobacteraceae bacterium]